MASSISTNSFERLSHQDHAAGIQASSLFACGQATPWDVFERPWSLQKFKYNHTILDRTSTQKASVTSLNVKHLLRNRYAWICLTCWMVQECSYVANRYFLFCAYNPACQGTMLSLYVGLFLLTLLLPRMLRPPSESYLELWIAQSTKHIKEVLIERSYNLPLLWGKQEEVNKVGSIFDSGLRKTIFDTIRVLRKLCGVSLKILLNGYILLLHLTLPIMVHLGVALLVAAAFYYIEKRYRQNLLSQAMNEFYKLNFCGHSFSDNVMLGNQINFQRWQTDYNQKEASYQKIIKSNAYFNIIYTWIKQLICVISSIVGLCYSMKLRLVDLFNEKGMLSMLGLLPGMIATANAILDISGYCYDLIIQNMQLKNIFQVHDTYTSSNALQTIYQRIHFEKIQLYKDGRPIALELLLQPGSLRELTGRLTLKGDNAMGKSSILVLLKHYFAQEAYLLPAKHNLFFGGPSGSSGQNLVHHFKELDGMQHRPVILLLDEWNTNLDQNNFALLSKQIDTWAQKGLVIEAIHPHEPE